jgi:hypothetical protein
MSSIAVRSAAAVIHCLHQQLFTEWMCRVGRPMMASYHSVQSHSLVPASYSERVALYRCRLRNGAVVPNVHCRRASPKGCLAEPGSFVAHESSQQGPYTATSISKAHASHSCTVSLGHDATSENSSKLAVGWMRKLARQASPMIHAEPRSRLWKVLSFSSLLTRNSVKGCGGRGLSLDKRLDKRKSREAWQFL